MPVGKPGPRSSSSFDLRGDGKKLPQLQTYPKLQVAVLSSRLPSQMWKAGRAQGSRRCDVETARQPPARALWLNWELMLDKIMKLKSSLHELSWIPPKSSFCLVWGCALYHFYTPPPLQSCLWKNRPRILAKLNFSLPQAGKKLWWTASAHILRGTQGLLWRRCSKNVCSVNGHIHHWTHTNGSVFIHNKLTPQQLMF